MTASEASMRVGEMFVLGSVLFPVRPHRSEDSGE